MRYIQSYELREWVKDNLRKTIFQKAHALAVQTGCEVLVKLHDNADVSGCQYYATNNLKKHYRSSKLRQPGEMMVSGETGLPLMDKCTQSNNGSNDYAIEDHATPADPSGRLADDRYSEADRTMELGESDQFNSVDSHSQGSQFDAPLEGEEDSQHHIHSSVDNGQLKTESTEMEDQEQVTTPSDVISIKTEPGLDMPESLDSNNSMITTSGSVPETSTPSTPPRVPISGSSVQRYAVPISPKPYPCSICQKTFRSIQILQKHTLMFHSRPKGHAPLTKVRGKLWGKGHGAQYFNRQPPQEDLLPQDYHCVICNHSFNTTDSLQTHVTQAHMGCATPQESPSTHTLAAAPQESSTSHMETLAMATSQQDSLPTSLQANQASYDNLTPSLIQTTASSELMQTGGAEQPHGAHSSSILDMAGTAGSLHHIFPNTLNMSQSNSPISFSLSGASTSSSLTSSPRRRGNASRAGTTTEEPENIESGTSRPTQDKPVEVGLEKENRQRNGKRKRPTSDSPSDDSESDEDMMSLQGVQQVICAERREEVQQRIAKVGEEDPITYLVKSVGQLVKGDTHMNSSIHNLQLQVNEGFAEFGYRLENLEQELERSWDAMKTLPRKVAPELVSLPEVNLLLDTPSNNARVQSAGTMGTSAASTPQPVPNAEHPQRFKTPADPFAPRYVSAPDPGFYLLGGEAGSERTVESYKVILKSAGVHKKSCTDDNERGRLLCMSLLRSEVSKEELSIKNVTGSSRSIDGDGISRRVDVPTINENILHMIFSQARQQFQGFSDWYTIKSCKTMKSLNDVCKKARLEAEKKLQDNGNPAEDLADIVPTPDEAAPQLDAYCPHQE